MIHSACARRTGQEIVLTEVPVGDEGGAGVAPLGRELAGEAGAHLALEIAARGEEREQRLVGRARGRGHDVALVEHDAPQGRLGAQSQRARRAPGDRGGERAHGTPRAEDGGQRGRRRGRWRRSPSRFERGRPTLLADLGGGWLGEEEAAGGFAFGLHAGSGLSGARRRTRERDARVGDGPVRHRLDGDGHHPDTHGMKVLRHRGRSFDVARVAFGEGPRIRRGEIGRRCARWLRMELGRLPRARDSREGARACRRRGRAGAAGAPARVVTHWAGGLGISAEVTGPSGSPLRGFDVRAGAVARHPGRAARAGPGVARPSRGSAAVARVVVGVERLVERGQQIGGEEQIELLLGRGDAGRVRPPLGVHPVLRGFEDLEQLAAELDGGEHGRALGLVEVGEDDGHVERIGRVRILRGGRRIAVVTERRRRGGLPGAGEARGRGLARRRRRLGERHHREHQRLDVDRPLEDAPVGPARAQLARAGRVSHADQLGVGRLPRALDRLRRARRVDVDHHHPRRLGEHPGGERGERHLAHREAALAQRRGHHDAVRRRHAHQDGVAPPRPLRVADVELRHCRGTPPDPSGEPPTPPGRESGSPPAAAGRGDVSAFGGGMSTRSLIQGEGVRRVPGRAELRGPPRGHRARGPDRAAPRRGHRRPPRPRGPAAGRSRRLPARLDARCVLFLQNVN